MSTVLGIVSVEGAALTSQQAPTQAPPSYYPNGQAQQQQVAMQNPPQPASPTTLTSAVSRSAGNAARSAASFGNEIIQENRNELKNMLAARMLGTNYYPQPIMYNTGLDMYNATGYPQQFGYNHLVHSPYPTTYNQLQAQYTSPQAQYAAPQNQYAPPQAQQTSAAGAECNCSPPLPGTSDVTDSLQNRKGPFSYPQVFLTSDPGTAPPLPLHPTL